MIRPLATARDTVHCTDIAAIMAPSIFARSSPARADQYITTKWPSETRNAAMISSSVNILSGMAMSAKATIGTQIRIEDRHHNADAVRR